MFLFNAAIFFQYLHC